MKKFCLVIAVILVFVVSCDNLYNDVAEEKKDMQKLIFVNADGVSVDLTKDPYGITEWEGFSKVDLNLQTQQVPFHDGSVYLDGLLSERELSVTLAMNDEKNLEKRYRLRRELISILNPKLGEGVLIYTNNYTSKQIKVIPQTPLFENHNSNDSGTPKASLAWTACDPYWEDIEETSVPLKTGVRNTIINTGDVPCGLNIHLFTNDVTNPQIKNFTEDKTIKLNGSYTSNININTNFGQKSVSTENIAFNISNNPASDLYSVTYSEFLGLFVAVGYSRKVGGRTTATIITSPDGINWTSRISGVYASLTSVTYSETQHLFVAVGGNGTIITSSDSIEWTIQTSGTSNALLSVTYSEIQNLFVAVGSNGTIITSPDGINWTTQTSGVSVTLKSVIYSETQDLFVAVGYNGTIITSFNGISWITHTIGTSNDLYSVTYSETQHLFVAVGIDATIVTSSDSISWTTQSSSLSAHDSLYAVTYAKSLNIFVAVGQKYLASTGIILTSPDGVNWTSQTASYPSFSPYSVVYADPLGLFNIVALIGTIITSSNGINWTVRTTGMTFDLGSVTYSESLGLFVATPNDDGKIIISSDGINWTSVTSTVNSFGLYSVTYIEQLNIFIAVGYNGKIVTSPDGINWTNQVSNVSVGLYSVTYSESLNLLVAVGSNGTIITSADAINWTLQVSGELVNLRSVTYSKSLNLFVAVGEKKLGYGYTVILKSSDGINWTSTNVYYDLYSVTYVEQLNIFITVGYNGTIITSPDGINWTIITSLLSTLKSVIYSEQLGLFMAVGNDGTIYISPDSVDWTKLDSFVTIDLYSVIYSNSLNIFIVVGKKGAILHSNFTSIQNLIADLTPDSNMTLSLEIGENVLLIGKNSGNLNGAVRYRQKYIGV